MSVKIRFALGKAHIGRTKTLIGDSEAVDKLYD